MKFCKKCVQPDTRPGIEFDEEGVCLPCRITERKSGVDWKARKQELIEIAEWGKKNSNSGYDCVIGVSGGKDSTRLAMYAKNELKLNALLAACTCPSEMGTEIGRHNLDNLKSLGFDTITITPNPKVWKALMRRAFFSYGNYGKSTELALYATPIRTAIAFKIPLVFFGENNALTYGDIGGSLGGDASKVKYNNTLSGGSPRELLGDGISEKDAIPYVFPSDEEIQREKLRIVYMGYYIEDFNNYEKAKFAISHGLKTRISAPEDIGAINKFDALDEDFVHVNQMLKYFKFGFGKATDEVSEAIRLGLMKREEGVELAGKYDGKCANKYIEAFCEYLNIDEKEFWEVADSYRNQDIWRKNKNGEWKMKYRIE